MKTLLTLTLTLLLVSPAFAKSKKTKSTQQTAKTIQVDQQLDGLGSNDEIIKKARALQPNNSMRIVQKREVDRNLRPELGLSYGYVSGGDTYLETRNWGANLDFHITPRWSLGLRYNDNKNALTDEGQRVWDAAAVKLANGDADVAAPNVAFPIRSYMAMINWYPIYGKVSWFESAVSQFDFYLTAGGGQVEWRNFFEDGTSPIFTGGAGVGVWINSWLTSRLEVRYQNYKDRVGNTDRTIDGVVMQFGIGIML